MAKFLTTVSLISAVWVSARGTLLPASPSVTLAWSPSPGGNIAGYHLYYGTTSHNYTNMVSVGTSASITISSLTEGTSYYFAVTAIDDLGMESGYSDEISYTVPSARPRLQLLFSPTKQVVLRITGQPGHTYEIQATQNFTNWNVVGVATLDLGVSRDFIDVNAASQPSRFYRLREILRPSLQLLISPTKQVVLRISGQPGHTYEIQATQDFTNWNVVGVVGLGLSVTLDFNDASASGRPARFYRLREIL